MKAIRIYEFGDPEVMRIEDVEELNPGRGQLLIRVYAAGVNPVDAYIRSGLYAFKPGLPYTPGMDAAGIVEAVGAGVKLFKMGDRVYISGTISGSYAEKALCNESQVHPLPERVSFAEGAAVGIPYGAAYRALFHFGRAMAGEVVLVHGASGGVGIAAVQLARAGGMHVIGTAGTEAGRVLAMEQGAHRVFDHRSSGYLHKIMESTDNRGVDLIVEMLANVNLGNDLTILARGGRVVIVGSRGKVEIDPRDIMRRDASILGMMILLATEDELRSIYSAISAGLENGVLRPVIGKEFPLSEAARAHREIMETSAHGKIVLIP
jgi:NADPH2:quinone reductase